MARSLSIIPDNKIKVILHALAWIIIIIIPLYLSNAFGGGNMQRLYEFYLHTFSAVLIFYVGYLWLVPVFFLQDKKAAYITILIGLILATYFLNVFIRDHFLYDPIQDARIREAMNKITGSSENTHLPMKAFGFYNHIVASVLISGFAMGLGLMDRFKQNEKKQKELEKEKLNSELAFLKNQISPHFFFNTLNNIYSLIGNDDPTARESVLELSKLMRYLLYESEYGETLISHEINFMNNYITLMKLRMNPKVKLTISFPDKFSDFPIPPLLFIPFIENAFKHGISYRDSSFIDIRMTIDTEHISFIAENSIGKSGNKEYLQYSGIGLDNVRKRLALLYPGKHELKIEHREKVFRVDLSIQKEKSQV